MKILLITATYPPSANGVAVSVYNTFKEFKKMGHEVTVLAPKTKGFHEKLEGEIRYPSISNPVRKDYPIPLLPVTKKIIKLVSKTKFDIVHAHHPFYISFFADVISSFNEIPFVFTYHTKYGEYVRSNFKFLPKKIARKISEYSAPGVCRRADLIIAPSEFMKKFLLKKHPNANIEVVPTGLPRFTVSNLSANELRKKYDLPTDKTILLCVSRIAKEKNSALLVRMMKNLPDSYYLVLVGTGPLEDKLIDWVRKNNISNRVTFMGKVRHEKVSDFYKLSDIYVFPSYTETQGLTLLEAAYFGLRMVAVESEVNSEWMKKGTGLIVKNNEKAFAQGVVKVDQYKKREVAEIAHNWAKRYSIKKTSEELIKHYKSVIKKGKQNGSRKWISRKNLMLIRDLLKGG